jgi:hypothetical protein
MDADHWAHLTDILRHQGVVVDARGLKRLPHEVVLSEALRERVGRRLAALNCDAVEPLRAAIRADF